MKILFIAPIPPPITGQALASQVLLEELRKHNKVEVINFNKGAFVHGINSFKRIIQVIKILIHVAKKKNDADVIYLTISQSIAGNIKDILTYIICYKRLQKMVIHLHGGGIKKVLFDKYKLVFVLNRFFIQRLGGVVVLGKSLFSVFDVMISHEKMHCVSNFAEDYIFLEEEKIRGKYEQPSPLSVLFLSNLISGKGYDDLAKAYKMLDVSFQAKIRIDFAGGFESRYDEEAFLNSIQDINGICYHGVVDAGNKARLLHEAHVLCLPTSYQYEGQPIAILEAYAAGCAVITTDQGGIKDIFKNEVHGFSVAKQNVCSLRDALQMIIEQKARLLPIALSNNNEAREKYRSSTYCLSLMKILEDVRTANR